MKVVTEDTPVTWLEHILFFFMKELSQFFLFFVLVCTPEEALRAKHCVPKLISESKE
jgi:hypothetical protein